MVTQAHPSTALLTSDLGPPEQLQLFFSDGSDDDEASPIRAQGDRVTAREAKSQEPLI